MRCTFKVNNPSKYPVLESTKQFVEVSRPYVWKTMQSKMCSYEVRLYYEWLHCQLNNGLTFYYTLTYNTKSVPRFNGVPCFRYSDLRDLLNGAFAKRLRRVFGYSFKYFVSCESGEGKGSRGYMNNPHYHVLFFLYPEENCLPISPVQFRSLVRLYWQGTTVGFDSPGAHPKAFKYGIAKEGSRKGYNDCGLVQDFHAVSYVCKYVVKDIDLHPAEVDSKSESESNSNRSFGYRRQLHIKKLLWDSAFRLVCEDVQVRNKFYSEFITDSDLVDYSFRDCQNDAERLLSLQDWFVMENQARFEKFAYPFVKEVYDSFCRQFINEYGSKVRISNGVGLSALKHIVDLDNPKLLLPSSKGMQSVNLGTYLYRKLYYDVKKDPVSGSPVYVLNSLGIKNRVRGLHDRIDCRASRFNAILPNIVDDVSLYSKVKSYVLRFPDFYPCCSFFPDFDSFLELVANNVERSGCISPLLGYRYGIWKEVYQGRFFSARFIDDLLAYPPIDFDFDYPRFLADTHIKEYYDPLGFNNKLWTSSDLYLSYEVHPYFYKDVDLFNLLDIFIDYFAFQDSEKSRKAFNEKRKVLDFHNSL